MYLRSCGVEVDLHHDFCEYREAITVCSILCADFLMKMTDTLGVMLMTMMMMPFLFKKEEINKHHRQFVWYMAYRYVVRFFFSCVWFVNTSMSTESGLFYRK